MFFGLGGVAGFQGGFDGVQGGLLAGEDLGGQGEAVFGHAGGGGGGLVGDLGPVGGFEEVVFLGKQLVKRVTPFDAGHGGRGGGLGGVELAAGDDQGDGGGVGVEIAPAFAGGPGAGGVGGASGDQLRVFEHEAVGELRPPEKPARKSLGWSLYCF